MTTQHTPTPWADDSGLLRISGTQQCECCVRTLNPARTVPLELDQRDDTYHNFGDVPPQYSQGWFDFGAACARKQIAKARKARALAKVTP